MEFFLLYLFVMLDEIRELAHGLGAAIVVLSTIIIAGHGAFLDWSDEKTKVTGTKWLKVLFFTLALGVILICAAKLIPGTKQAAIIIGGGAVYNVVTSEEGKRVANKIGSKLEHELNKVLEVDDVP